ncbi:MAG: 1-deoxy-D-xylulose-5-phosphate synthase [Chromatiales bacterium]|jgi:1-deoxy-D-xylulose-5-phosphate synthase|nr:1-deoxy-D-xylulose-5-phosphate synthase [Chromatiales bacterium]MDH3932791.1 1-deoxy-D-xylulose-5-phosphate synthase [Chromatiales bacterium]MDH4014738.1 1-deoxy-D-xylulose-5-phosphate synthase [Chromatiales bacterium]
MIDSSTYPLLSTIDSPEDLRRLPADQIGAVAEELRRYLIETVSTMGGHFAAGLGTVELTIALHYVFDTPDDRLIWDVGHQAYPHKVITGRRDQLHTIKRKDGLAPFPKRGESPFDVFGVGHSSTSVSAGLGMAIAAALQNQTRKVVAVIGDGALTGGMAFEALNHAGSLNVDMLVVLNDNDMSISENVGAMSNYLAKMLSGKLYSHIREGSKKVLRTMPTVWELARRSEEHVKGMVLPGTLFEEMGLNYIGPIDGHDLDTLVKTLENLRNLKGPQFLHVVTRKGKGYAPAERDPIKWHGPGPFDPATGTFRAKAAAGLTYSQVFGQWLCDIAAQDERVVAITPAMREGSGLVQYSRDFPDRYFDVAIAEQHAVTLGAGFACEGMRPVVAIYSTFLQRGYDQLIHDVALQNLPVLFAIDRAGLVGGDGATHQGLYDICFMRCLPNMTIMAPADEDECRQMLFTGLQLEGPAAVRYPRGSGPGVLPEQEMRALPVGKAQLRRKGNGIALLAFGAMVGAAESIGARLDASVVNMRFVKPLDVDMVMRMAETHDALVTIEDGVVAGGAGGAIIECLAEQGKLIPVLNIGIGDRIIEHGSRRDNLADAGLDEESLYRTIDNWRPSVPAAAPGGIV